MHSSHATPALCQEDHIVGHRASSGIATRNEWTANPARGAVGMDVGVGVGVAIDDVGGHGWDFREGQSTNLFFYHGPLLLLLLL